MNFENIEAAYELILENIQLIENDLKTINEVVFRGTRI